MIASGTQLRISLILHLAAGDSSEIHDLWLRAGIWTTGYGNPKTLVRMYNQCFTCRREDGTKILFQE
jgi:hypothetical protein